MGPSIAIERSPILKSDHTLILIDTDTGNFINLAISDLNLNSY